MVDDRGGHGNGNGVCVFVLFFCWISAQSIDAVLERESRLVGSGLGVFFFLILMLANGPSQRQTKNKSQK